MRRTCRRHTSLTEALAARTPAGVVLSSRPLFNPAALNFGRIKHRITRLVPLSGTMPLHNAHDDINDCILPLATHTNRVARGCGLPKTLICLGRFSACSWIVGPRCLAHIL